MRPIVFRPQTDLVENYLTGGGRGHDRPFPNHEVAERNRVAMLEQSPWMETGKLGLAAQNIINSNASKRSKNGRLIQLVDQAHAALAPFSACKRGCSHCCNIPTIIFSSEAEQIAKAIGRKVARIARRDVEVVRKTMDQYRGQPCPFLANGECSIYENRPFTCRQHHSLDIDASQCNLDVLPEVSSVPSYSGMKAIELIFTWLHGRDEALGDIREFFPLT